MQYTMSQKIRKIVALCLFTLLCSCSAPASSDAPVAEASDETGLLLPDKDKIAAAYLEFYNHPFFFPEKRSEKLEGTICEEAIAVFEQFGEIRLDTNSHDPSNRSEMEIGSIRFVDTEGVSIRISWFFLGTQEPLRLSVRGLRGRAISRKFSGEETLVLDARLRALLEPKSRDIPGT